MAGIDPAEADDAHWMGLALDEARRGTRPARSRSARWWCWTAGSSRRGHNTPIAASRSHRARRDRRAARGGAGGGQLPADRRDALRHHGAVRDVLRGGAARAHRAGGLRRRGREGRRGAQRLPAARRRAAQSPRRGDRRRARDGVRGAPQRVLPGEAGVRRHAPVGMDSPAPNGYTWALEIGRK